VCDVLGGPALETVDPDRRHAAAATLMEADREIVLLGCAPERLVHRIVDQPVVVGSGLKKPPRMRSSLRANLISWIACSTDWIGSIRDAE